MEDIAETSSAAEYLEEIFHALNSHFFHGRLERPVITIQSAPQLNSYITTEKEWQTSTNTRRELNIAAEILDSPIENIVVEMLHECAHIWDMQNGIADCSRNETYHNKRFKETAESCGLLVQYTKKNGWCSLYPQQELLDFINKMGWKKIQMNRTGRSDGYGKPTSTRKYMCPVCGNSVRATKSVNIGCLDCGVAMELVLRGKE